MASCFVYKVIRTSSSGVYTLVFYLAILNKVVRHCQAWLARQYLYQYMNNDVSPDVFICYKAMMNVCTVLPAKSGNGVMLCLQSYQDLE